MEQLINPSPYGGRTSPKMHYEGERGYMELLWDLLHFGHDMSDRTGVGRRKLFGVTQRYDLRKGFPHPTVRSTPVRIAFEEYWAFLNGRVDIHTYLNEKGITIWEGNTTREFLDNRGLSHLPVGHMGKAYGFQYRHFNGEYDENFMPKGGIDQIKNVYESLLKDPFGSRHVVSIWNPAQEPEMALPPCLWNFQFVVIKQASGENVLNLLFSMRSNDTLFGFPFNLTSMSLVLACMAKATGMVAGEVMCSLADVHLYGKIGDLMRPCAENNPASQIRYTAETLQRTIYETPVQLQINKDILTFDDFIGLQFDDFTLTGLKVNKTKYTCPRPIMAV